ncbi:MAG: MinD/ParA family protein [Alphaproteobacteria bacterium]
MPVSQASNVTPLHPAMAPRGQNIIAVASGKGGVGKTWFAVTLANAFAELGRRVLLFDGDLGLANVDIQLGLVPKRDLGGVIAGRFGLSDAVTRYDDGGFDILPGRSGSGALASLNANRLAELRDDVFALADSYDHVIADMGAGVDPSARLMTNSGGMLLVVATDEPTALTDAYAFIKVTAANNSAADIRIVVNMAQSRQAGVRTYETLANACDKFLGARPPLAGTIRQDSKVKDAIRHQTALLRRHPGCQAGADVAAIAKAILSGP